MKDKFCLTVINRKLYTDMVQNGIVQNMFITESNE